VLTPRSKLSLIAAELSRRTYHGRVYAKAQNVRPTYIQAYDAALAQVDVLVLPTCL
jgi:amidase